MYGKIELPSTQALADFLKHFAGATAKFRAYPDLDNAGAWIVEFTGAY